MAETSANIGEALLDHAVGSSTGGQGYEQQQGKTMADNVFFKALSQGPGVLVSTTAGGYRGANTIIGGGWTERSQWGKMLGRSNVGTGPARSIRENNPLNPASWFRFSEQKSMYETGEGYTPFQVAADWSNKAVNFVANRSSGLKESLVKKGLAEEGKDVHLFTSGAYSRYSAGVRLQNMSHARVVGNWGSTVRFMEGAGFTGGAEGEIAALSKGGQRAVGQAIGMSGKGVLSAKAAGFMAGASRGGLTKEAADVMMTKGLAGQAGVRMAAKAEMWGAQAAMKAFGHATSEEAGEFLAKRLAPRAAAALIKAGGPKAAAYVGARALAFATEATNPIGWVLMAYDIAKIGVTLTGAAVSGGIRMTADVMRSFKGGISTAIMDQGFRDNSTSISSRSRGVAAIQNSRLNARSVLGAEAGAMHAHFG